MTFRKMLAASAVSAALLLSAPAAAQGLQPGATITHPEAGEVGTVVGVEDGFVVLRTDRHEARYPVDSFTVTDEAILFGYTRDEVNRQVDEIEAQRAAALTVGALVHDRDGLVVGPIDEVDAQTVIVSFEGRLIRFPRGSVAVGPSGAVVGNSVADLRAQIAASSPATDTATD